MSDDLEARIAQLEQDISDIPAVRARREQRAREARYARAREIISAPDALDQIAALTSVERYALTPLMDWARLADVIAGADDTLRMGVLRDASQDTRDRVRALRAIAAGTMPEYLRVSRPPRVGTRPEIGRAIRLTPVEVGRCESAGIQVRRHHRPDGACEYGVLFSPRIEANGGYHVIDERHWEAYLRYDAELAHAVRSGDVAATPLDDEARIAHWIERERDRREAQADARLMARDESIRATIVGAGRGY